MMTRFNIKKSVNGYPLLWGYSLLLCVCIGLLGAEPNTPGAKDIFQTNAESILTNNVLHLDGYVFCKGIAAAKSGSDASKAIALEKAELWASSKLIDDYFQKVQWPKSFSEGFQKKVWNEFLKCGRFELVTQKGVSVYSQYKNREAVVIMAYPEEFVTGEVPDFETIKTTLLDLENYLKKPVQLSVCLELQKENIPSEMLTAYALRMGEQYGRNVGLVVAGKSVDSFSVPKAGIADLGLKELFLALDKSPYESEICYRIGEKLDEMEMPVSAKLFYSRGMISKGAEYFGKCSEKLGEDNPFPNEIEMPEVPWELFAKYQNEGFEDESLQFLKKYAGKIPIGMNKAPAEVGYYKMGMTAYNDNRLSLAYELFKASASKQLTFDACNMAGNVGRRIGKTEEAIAFLLQAAAINPAKAYPWVHLAIIFDQNDDVELKDFCIQKAETFSLDDWSKKQLNTIKN